MGSKRAFDNLPSLVIQPSGVEGAGPQDLKFDSSGNAYGVYGFAGDPAAIQSSRTVRSDSYTNSTQTQVRRLVSPICRYELANNPDGGDVVSNPYALAIKDDTACR